MAEFVKLAKIDDIGPDEMAGFVVNHVKVGVANIGGEFFAFHNCCTHQQYELTDGFLMGERLTCDWHGATFDIRTGEVKTLPATKPLPMFDVEVRDGEVWVAVPDADDLDMPPE